MKVTHINVYDCTVYIRMYRYEQKAVFAVVIPRFDYLKECLTKQGLEVVTFDNSTLCSLNEAIKLVSGTSQYYTYVTA